MEKGNIGMNNGASSPLLPPPRELRRSRSRSRGRNRSASADSGHSKRSREAATSGERRVIRARYRDARRSRSKSRGRSRSRNESNRRRRSGSIPDRAPKQHRPSRSRSRQQREKHAVVVVRQRRRSSARSRSPIRRELQPREYVDSYAHQPATNVSLSQLVEALQVIKNSASQNSLPFSTMQNVIPEFDPSRKEQTVEMWLHKVNESAVIYDWNERQTIHFALPKLKGIAQKWFEGLNTLMFTWQEWQLKLKAAFPSYENYGQLLSNMLAKRARFGEPLENYYYEKVLLLNRCGITGQNAIDCIIFGIEDRSIRLGAEAAQFDSTEKLLCYLRNAKCGKINSQSERRKIKSFEQKTDNSVVKFTGGTKRNVTCFNCNEEGHFKSDCPKPIIKCNNCQFFGHTTDKCNTNKQTKEITKKVLKVRTNKTNDKKYFKQVTINGVSKKGFIDFGSNVTMIKDSEISNLNCEWVMDNDLPVLKGFGRSIVQTLKKGIVNLAVDGVEARVELLVVPDYVMDIPVLIGQTFTEQTHITFVKDSETLNISLRQQKIQLFCAKDTIVKGLTNVKVCSKPVYSGNIYIERSLRYKAGTEHEIKEGLFELNNGECDLLIEGGAKDEFIIKAGTLIARGSKASENLEMLPEINILNIKSAKNKTITTKDLNVDTGIGNVEIEKLTKLLNKYRSSFAFNLNELGKATGTEMNIKLKDDGPVTFRPYRLSAHERSKVRNMVQELIDNDIIRPSSSPYSSPIVLVKKKNGEIRMCIDYRGLNRKTIKEHYPLPRIDDQIDDLAGYSYYTTLDLRSGYYQIQIREEDRHKTAFITPDGHYEFNRMPFGLVNAPAVFMRMISQVLGQARHKIASAYMDDIIIPSRTVKEGMERLEKILQLLQDAGLTINLEKCCFFRQNVEYLGFELSKDGVKPGTKKLQAVQQFTVPKDQHNVRQFIGLCSFFRRFIKNFAQIAKPLTSLLKKDSAWMWKEEQEQAFRQLKSELVQKPVLGVYNPKAETELHTDASKTGIAGMLMQRDNQKKLRPIAYFSRQTTTYEQNMTAYELETLAVVASAQRFRVYLLGVEFKIVTDCNSLRATFLKRDIIPRVARWWIILQEYNFSVEYRPGTSMCHVDALSRNSITQQDVLDTQDDTRCFVMQITDDWLKTVQQTDADILQIISILKGPNNSDVTDVKDKYVIKDGMLYRKTTAGERWVVPKGVRWQIMRHNHDDLGHFGIDKTLARVQASYWFPRLRQFVKKYVRSCLECSYTKTLTNNKPPLHPIQKVNIPFDTIHIDHVGPFIKSSKGNTHILVIIEAYTKFICLKAVSSTSTAVTINKLKDYFSVFGTPKRLISDRGSSFTSTSFKKFMTDLGIKHVLNAVATPRANGQVERYNRTLLEALTAKCIGRGEKKWDSYVPEVQWGLNNTNNRGIGCTPSEALFGLKLNGMTENKIKSYIDTDQADGRSLQNIRDGIDEYVEQYQQKQKQIHDSKIKNTKRKFAEGELVGVQREVPSTGYSRKLVPKFQGPYKITKVLEHDRYMIEDTPLTRKNNRSYNAIVAIDKIKPWLVFQPPHLLGDEQDHEGETD